MKKSIVVLKNMSTFTENLVLGFFFLDIIT